MCSYDNYICHGVAFITKQPVLLMSLCCIFLKCLEACPHIVTSSLLCVIHRAGYRTNYHDGSAGRRRMCWPSSGQTSRIDGRCWHRQRKRQTQHWFTGIVRLPPKEVICASSASMIQPYGYIPTIVMSCRCSAKEAIPLGKTSGRRSSSSPLEKKKKVLTTASILFFLRHMLILCYLMRPLLILQSLSFRLPGFRIRLLLGIQHSRPGCASLHGNLWFCLILPSLCQRSNLRCILSCLTHAMARSTY